MSAVLYNKVYKIYVSQLGGYKVDGLIIGRQHDCLDEVEQESAKLSLLARGSGIEVMKQKIHSGTAFYLYPGNDSETIEFFYVLEGELTCGELSVTLKENDYFFVKDLKDIVFFEANSEVTMLWMINEPVFRFISEKISKLLDVVNMVEKKDHYTLKA